VAWGEGPPIGVRTPVPSQPPGLLVPAVS